MSENRDLHLNTKVSPTEDALFRAAARARGLTISEAMREALGFYAHFVIEPTNDGTDLPGGPERDTA